MYTCAVAMYQLLISRVIPAFKNGWITRTADKIIFTFHRFGTGDQQKLSKLKVKQAPLIALIVIGPCADPETFVRGGTTLFFF